MKGRDLLWILVIGLAAAVAGWFLGSPASLSSQEGIGSLVKAKQFAMLFDLQDGPRWWDQNFLGGASTVLSSGFALSWFWLLGWEHFFSAEAAVRLAILSLLPAAAVATFCFARELSGDRAVAWISVPILLAMPVLWETGIGMEKLPFVAGAAISPWVFYFALRMAKAPSPTNSFFLAVSLSALLLSNWTFAFIILPGLAVFSVWALWKNKGLAPLLRFENAAPFLIGLLLLGLLPLAPLFRELSMAIGPGMGAHQIWREVFASKNLLQLFDRSGVLSFGFREDFSPDLVAGSFFLGLVPCACFLVVVIFRKRIFPAGEIPSPLRVAMGVFLVFYWLSFGPFSPLSGTLRALSASGGVAPLFPAILWGLLLLQGTVLHFLLPPTMPLRKSCFLLLVTIFLVVPGMNFLAILPVYRGFRAPMDFLFVGAVILIPVIAAMVLNLIWNRLRNHRGSKALVFSGFALALALDFLPLATSPRENALPPDLGADFKEAMSFLEKQETPGAVVSISGRYFYLQIPELTGRPLVTEAFFAPLQLRHMAMFLESGNASLGTLLQAWTLAGARYVFLDKRDPDFPEELADQFRQRLQAGFSNESFEILVIANSLAPAFSANHAVGLSEVTIPNLQRAISLSSDGIVAIGPLSPQPPAGTLSNGTFEPAPGDAIKDTLRRLSITTVPEGGRSSFVIPESNSGNWIIATTAWHPDWKVSRDGLPQVLLQGFGSLLATKGDKDGGGLVFNFEPPFWYPVCLVLGVGSWILALLALVIFFLRRMTVALRKQTADEGIADAEFPAITNPLVITPTYNEAASLPQLLDALLTATPQIHILVIDDSSPDGTAKIARNHPAFGQRVHLLERAGKLGLGSAYREGFRWAAEHGYDACLEIDADLSHDPKDVPRLLQKLEEGHDAVIGSRYLDGLRVVNWPEERLLISSFATQFVRFMLGMPLTDATSGFKALRVEALSKLNWEQVRADGYGFQVELHHALWKSGAKITEVPIVFTERREGKTKMTAGIAWEAAMRVFQLAVAPRYTGKTPA